MLFATVHRELSLAALAIRLIPVSPKKQGAAYAKDADYLLENP